MAYNLTCVGCIYLRQTKTQQWCRNPEVIGKMKLELDHSVNLTEVLVSVATRGHAIAGYKACDPLCGPERKFYQEPVHSIRERDV